MKVDTIVNGESGTLTVEPSRFVYKKNGAALVETDYTLQALGRDDFSVLANGRSFRVSILPNGEISVNGRVYQVDIVDPRGLRGRKTNGAASGKKTVTAPMPGRVIRVLVETGQSVTAGQGLIVVEAMKMQNEMKAPQAGVVTQVKTSVGATVTAGDVLLVLE